MIRAVAEGEDFHSGILDGQQGEQGGYQGLRQKSLQGSNEIFKMSLNAIYFRVSLLCWAVEQTAPECTHCGF